MLKILRVNRICVRILCIAQLHNVPRPQNIQENTKAWEYGRRGGGGGGRGMK